MEHCTTGLALLTALLETPERTRHELALQDWLGSAGFDRPEDHWPRQWAHAYVDFAAGEKRSWLRQMGHRFFPVVASASEMSSSRQPAQPPGCSVYDPAKDVYFTCHHYGAFNTEPRIASYLGIAFGQVPATHYFRMSRTFPPTCDWGWQEQQPAGVTRTYLGVEVFEGHYRYRGMDIVPSWGGSMFEALMVPLLVPEARWGPRSWGVNHPLYVRAQVEHGLEEAGYGYWGFSPSNNPSGGYREYGVDAIGLNPDGQWPHPASSS